MATANVPSGHTLKKDKIIKECGWTIFRSNLRKNLNLV